MGQKYQNHSLIGVCVCHSPYQYGLITFCDHADDLEPYHILETDGQVPTHVPKVAWQFPTSELQSIFIQELSIMDLLKYHVGDFII